MAQMDIILLERVEKLGNIGDVVSVKPGFARNFLLPQGKALRANEQNRARFDADRERIERENADRRANAETEAQKLEGTQVVILRQSSDSGQLYGSVSARDIAQMLGDKGFKLDKTQVSLAAPIKALGVHEVLVALHPEVSVSVEANVARSEEEAEMQRQGIDIFGDTGEDEMLSDSERLAREALERAEAQAEAEARGVVLDENGEPVAAAEGGSDAEGAVSEEAPAEGGTGEATAAQAEAAGAEGDSDTASEDRA